MKPTRIEKVVEWSEGKLLSGNGSIIVTGVSTDTRTVKAGDLYVALVGERFDGHDFIRDAVAAGAVAVMVSKEVQGVTKEIGIVEVKNTLLGLQQWAWGYRKTLKARLVALTGSNGKTTTKDFLAAILAKKGKTRKTFGNLNNHIGVPLTLLQFEDEEYGVIEMGMNHAGEIKILVDIADPNDGLVTNVGLAHIEYLGSQDAIAWEKATLVLKIDKAGEVVLHSNDAYTAKIARACQGRVTLAGVENAEVRAEKIVVKEGGMKFDLVTGLDRCEVELPLMGEHMVINAVLAAAMGWRLGVNLEDIAAALNEVQITGGRMQIKEWQGIQIVDDSYNANPDSMKAGLRAFAQMSGKRKVAVLGEMGELGVIAKRAHYEVGAALAKVEIDEVCCVGGELAEEIRRGAESVGFKQCQRFENQEACVNYLKSVLKNNDSLFLKGSRSSAMEKVFVLLKS